MRNENIKRRVRMAEVRDKVKEQRLEIRAFDETGEEDLVRVILGLGIGVEGIDPN